ncbi:hypothetical protein C8A03DRAFT_33807 [Achaetomium macrosporum]|uniref:Uncharacterized protein n=1 Tax=Achaetomium macrosporum TaxID=79813 RepID=A0AAN7H741_9PEZI|nr:hypothetical protein C8A03DRAFT_33807 [Achaetomium macrosporum]
MPIPDHHQVLPDGVNACVLEDIQLRRKIVRQHLDNRTDTMNPGLPTPPAIPTTKVKGISSPLMDKDIEALEKEHAALRIALDLSRAQLKQDETQRQALLEQTRLEAAYREQQAQRSKVAAERREEKEKAAAAAAAAEAVRRMEEEEAMRAVAAAAAYRAQRAKQDKGEEHERVVREQLARERELKIQAEIEMRVKAEKERLAREAAVALKVQREMERAKELEDAAVARAMEESILTETVRKLEGERMVEAVKERARREAEAKVLEERLRKRVGGKKGPAGLFGSGFPPLGGRVDEVRAFAPHGAKPAAYPPTNRPYATTAYAGGNRGLMDPLPEPTWYDHTPPPAPAPFPLDTRFEKHFSDFDRWDHGLGLGIEGKVWRKTTTERWETVIQEEEGHDGRGYREVSKTARDFR